MKKFRLTGSDKEQLKLFGYLDKDFNQIEFAANEVSLFYNNKKISVDECITLIGRKRFLSGIARAAFHMTVVRSASEDETKSVLFDGHDMWKRWIG